MHSVLTDVPARVPLWVAVDATPEERPEAETNEERGSIHVSNVPLADTPIRSGWMFPVVGLLPEQASRWTLPLDFQRISREQTAGGVAVEQLQRLKPLFGTRQVIVVADRWDRTPEMLRACHELGDGVLIRLKSHRTLSRQPACRFQPGRPPVDGSLVQGTRPATPCDPSATWETTDQDGRTTRVGRSEAGHVHQDRDLILSVIRVERPSARGTTRDPRVSWFLPLDTRLPLEQVPQRDGLRGSDDHLFRFLTQDVLWLAARVRTPEPGLRWRWIVALAFLQVSVARERGQHALLPWEANGRPVTPRQVRRVIPTMLSQGGTPVRVCQPRGKAPGRAKGFRPRQAPHSPVIHRTSNKEKQGNTVSSI